LDVGQEDAPLRELPVIRLRERQPKAFSAILDELLAEEKLGHLSEVN
jgi:hypothetical protein